MIDVSYVDDIIDAVQYVHSTTTVYVVPYAESDVGSLLYFTRTHYRSNLII